ncbi:uncharacterized protein N7529_007143 [Penicillium soppii]|uniref:uncharacterized protein n=1 Tax=Penicillium soppii TaxID=69789 RepID=UPI00254724CA|nr:uncharacterized protein N7529_007143 [Penicillium soppii]KAJ5865227.1 hypothetical protein N7529_007143 [Penicillium soppii]
MTEDMVIGGHAATRLRRLLAENQIILAPRVYDGFNARIALEVGFDCLYITGAGTCASELGQPGLGFATLNDMRNHAEMIANLDPRFPLIADADTGYGGPDMIQTKQCGHLGCKAVVQLEVFVSRFNAAAAARRKLKSDIGDSVT